MERNAFVTKLIPPGSVLNLITRICTFNWTSRLIITIKSVTYHSILRYPLAQQWRLLNFCVTTYSRELSSFVNCNHVELFWKVSITQKSSTPLTPGKLNMVMINPNITQCNQAVFIPSDSALEAVLEHDTIFTPVVVTLKLWLRSYCNQFSFLIYSRFINPAVQKMAARKFEIISRNNKYTHNFVTHMF